MVLSMGLVNATKKITCLVLINCLVLISAPEISAQSISDSSKKPLLAALETKAGSRYIIKKSNVIFPEIFKGNEAEMLDYIKTFSTKRRDYLVRMYNKGKAFLPKAASILKKYDVPAEFKVLLTLESAYNGNAVSKAGAVGYWQIMDEVAREYGMKYIAKMSAAEKKRMAKLTAKKGGKKNKKALAKIKDDRKNFNIATHTAARYLRDRRRNLADNWLLIAASYNCGVGNVWNAMERSGKPNPTFWDIKNYLPAETRAYVLNFITLNVIFNNYELFASNKLSFENEKILLQEDLESTIITDEAIEY